MLSFGAEAKLILSYKLPDLYTLHNVHNKVKNSFLQYFFIEKRQQD